MAEKIKLTFLGTGSAIPTARRNHPAMLLQYKDENILIDCGEATQKQFRIAKINPCRITRILITHWHGDHVLGLPGLLQTLAFNGYNQELKIYGPKGTREFFSAIKGLFIPKNDKIKIQVNEVSEGKFIEEKDFFIEASEMSHSGARALAYSFNVKEKNRIDKAKLKKLKIPFGPLIGELKQGKTIELNGKKIDGKKIIYKEDAKKIAVILDTSFNDNCVKLAKNSDLLICESTYSISEKELAEEHSHLTSKDAAEIAKKSNSKKLALIHLSQRYENNPKIILNEAKKIFKNSFIPEDFNSLEI